jgi:hypothetical protein
VSVAELLGVRDITDRSVEPYIEHLALGTLYRYRDTPIEVTGHSTGLQPSVQPALALAIDVRTPLLVILENPLLQPLLVFVQRQVPVLGGLLGQWVTVDGVIRIDEFIGREGSTTFLALVAVGTEGMATWTLTADVTVGEELLGLLVIELLGGLFDEFSVLVEFLEEVRSELVVNLARRAAVNVERDAKLLEGILDEVVIAIYNILDGDSLLAGTDGNRHAMFVRTSNEKDGTLLEAQIADIDVGWYINTCQVSDMYRTIGIGESSCYERAFELIFCHRYFFMGDIPPGNPFLMKKSAIRRLSNNY